MNPRPSDCESLPITTRPGLPPLISIVKQTQLLHEHNRILGKLEYEASLKIGTESSPKFPGNPGIKILGKQSSAQTLSAAAI